MRKSKKVMVYVPEKFLIEYDEVIQDHFMSRSSSIVDAMHIQIQGLKKSKEA